MDMEGCPVGFQLEPGLLASGLEGHPVILAWKNTLMAFSMGLAWEASIGLQHDRYTSAVWDVGSLVSGMNVVWQICASNLSITVIMGWNYLYHSNFVSSMENNLPKLYSQINYMYYVV